MEKKTEIQLYVEETSSQLVDAAKEGISTLIADVRRKETSKPNRHGKARAKRQKSYR